MDLGRLRVAQRDSGGETGGSLPVAREIDAVIKAVSAITKSQEGTMRKVVQICRGVRQIRAVP